MTSWLQRRSRFIPELRESGLVQRYHCWRTLNRQSVGEHTWQVMRIILHIHPYASRELLVAAMFHDAAEVRTGDIPLYAKRNRPDFKASLDSLEEEALQDMLPPELNQPLSLFEQKLLKVADLIEMGEFAREEMEMGNRTAEPILHNINRAILLLIAEFDFPDQIEQSILTHWNYIYFKEEKHIVAAE